ncbi:MAG: phage capsid protein [Alphaproteobacteria bacterium]
MSDSVDEAFVQQYAKEVHEAFQRRGSLLIPTVRVRDDVEGASITFQKVGKGTATTKARHGVITPMNQDHTPVECTLADYYAGDWVDKFDEARTAHGEREVIVNAGAWALGRKADELILNAVGATAGEVGDHSGAVSRALLLAAVEALDAADVPDDGERWGLLTPRQWSAALTIAEFASGDYVGKENTPFAQTKSVRSWLGVKWLKHTGLPGKGTATAKGFVYHRAAAGFARTGEMKVDVSWHGDRASWFVSHALCGGACLIDAEGVVALKTDDTAAIPAS